MRISGMSRRLLNAALCWSLLLAGRGVAARAAPPLPIPNDLGSAVVYCIYPAIFSPQGNFDGVAKQLPRLKSLGVTIVWLMPVTPIGAATHGHPTFDSPYCVRDYYGINPAYGTHRDLKKLVALAHRLGMRVILDEVLNHTSWDNPLIQTHPQFYAHEDNNPKNSDSIVQAFNYSDVAQLNYADPGLRRYMIDMLVYWVKTYDLDGFRFDSADNPYGPNRKIPAGFWRDAAQRLRRIKSDMALIGESEDPALAFKPFSMDYGWWLHDSLKAALNGGDAAQVAGVWQHQNDAFPKGMLHLSLQDDWDFKRDIAEFGGPQGALAAAAFYETINGVPLIYNGMEIGNAEGEVNPHAPIDWNKANPLFPAFYRQMLSLRRSNLALQQGALTWVNNSAPSAVLTYERTSGVIEFLVEINLSNSAAQGTVTVPDGGSWVEVTPSAGPKGTRHPSPSQFTLGPKDLAIFKRVSRPISEAKSEAPKFGG